MLAEELEKQGVLFDNSCMQEDGNVTIHPVMQSCFLNLRNARLEDREAVGVTLLGHWVGGSTGPCQLFLFS